MRRASEKGVLSDHYRIQRVSEEIGELNTAAVSWMRAIL